MPDLHMRRVVVVPCDLAVDITELRIYVGDGGLAALQAIVEGDEVEAVPYPDGRADVACYFNDEAKRESIPVLNHRASRLLAASLIPGDYLAGNVVVAGATIDTGALADLPRDLSPDVLDELIAEPATAVMRATL